MTDTSPSPAPFDPAFDDTEWTTDWLQTPIALPPPGLHASGYRVVQTTMRQAEVFGRPFRLTTPFDCRALLDPDGRLWMSTTPQEHIMMYNNARRSAGHVLVGGLGLGLYPQYAEAGHVHSGRGGTATRFTIIESSAAVQAIMEPFLAQVLRAPFTVQQGDIAAYLAGPTDALYDTIFLDTWDTLDAAELPGINRLRDLAVRHLAPGGRILLWGYRWMVRLFEEACVQLLSVPPLRRRPWLIAQAEASPRAVELLMPVVTDFRGQVIEDMETALDWCREYIISATPTDS
jgi:hypothetical protein